MSILDELLKEEYERSLKIKEAIEKELEDLPDSYLSTKIINEKPYYYLQKRSADKIISSYVPVAEVDEKKKLTERRKKLKKSLKEVSSNLKKLEKLVK